MVANALKYSIDSHSSFPVKKLLTSTSAAFVPQFVGFIYFALTSDTISGVAVDYAGMDVRVKCGDSRSNGSRDIRRADSVSTDRTNDHDPIRPNSNERLLSEPERLCRRKCLDLLVSLKNGLP